MKLNPYEQSAKDCNLTGKLFYVSKVNILVQLKAVEGLDEELTFVCHHTQLNNILFL